VHLSRARHGSRGAASAVAIRQKGPAPHRSQRPDSTPGDLDVRCAKLGKAGDGKRPVDKWTAAPRLTTSPQAQQQQKRSIHWGHKPVNYATTKITRA